MLGSDLGMGGQKNLLPFCVLAQIPKLGCEIDQIHAAFSVGESNFGEVGGGQRKRLLNSGFRCE